MYIFYRTLNRQHSIVKDSKFRLAAKYKDKWIFPIRWGLLTVKTTIFVSTVAKNHFDLLRYLNCINRDFDGTVRSHNITIGNIGDLFHANTVRMAGESKVQGPRSKVQGPRTQSECVCFSLRWMGCKCSLREVLAGHRSYLSPS